jgi:hypothetical protein
MSAQPNVKQKELSVRLAPCTRTTPHARQVEDARELAELLETLAERLAKTDAPKQRLAA